jgi:hypothetical protein
MPVVGRIAAILFGLLLLAGSLGLLAWALIKLFLALRSLDLWSSIQGSINSSSYSNSYSNVGSSHSAYNSYQRPYNPSYTSSQVQYSDPTQEKILQNLEMMRARAEVAYTLNRWDRYCDEQDRKWERKRIRRS